MSLAGSEGSTGSAKTFFKTQNLAALFIFMHCAVLFEPFESFEPIELVILS